MDASVNSALPMSVVALPFVSAVVLSLVGSWRMATTTNAVAATAQFLVACGLPWFVAATEAYLVLLTAFVAMTTSWFGLRVQQLDQRNGRRYHAGYQLFIGAILLAVLAGDPTLTWFALVIAVAAAALVIGAAGGPAAASRMLLLCGVGLMLALLGILLPGQAPGLAGLCLLLGYGALAGVVPLHSWLANAAAGGIAPGAIIVTTLLPNVPLLLFMRLDVAPELSITLGLASLLLGAFAMLAFRDVQRAVALAGMSQIGMIVFAVGIGATVAAWLHMTLLALARAAVLQSDGNDRGAWLTLALLPLYSLYLLAGSTVAIAAWLLLPLAAGALLTALVLLERRPATWEFAPRIWFQVALLVVLAFALPRPVLEWVRVAAPG
jgi:hydrogenase-4 component F